MFSRITALLLGAFASCAAMAEQYTLPRSAITQLPSVAAATEEPAAFVKRMSGVATYPTKRGSYLLYRHGTLWYWFGPIPSDREARLDLSRLRGLIAEMRAKNVARYRDASARVLTIDSDDTLINLDKVDRGIELGEVLDRLQNLERLKVLADDLKNLGKRDPKQVAAQLQSSNMRTLDLVLHDNDSLNSKYSVLGAIPQIDAKEADKLRSEIGWRLFAGTLPPGDVAKMRANGADAAGMIALGAAGDAILRELDPGGDSAARLKGQVNEARKALADDPKSTTDGVAAGLGALALGALGGNDARKQRLQMTVIAQADLESTYRRANQQNLKGVADAIEKAIDKARARPLAPDENFGPPGPGTFIGMMQEGQPNSQDPFKTGQIPSLPNIDLGVAAQYGLNPSAAKDLIPELAGNESDGKKHGEKLKEATAKVANALADSLAGEIGVPPEPRGVPMTPELAELLKKSIERRSGKMPPVKSGATVEEAIAAAAGELANELANPNGDDKISLSPGDVRELGRQLANSGGSTGAPGGTPGAPETPGGTNNTSGGAQSGDAQSSSSNSSSSKGGKGHGQAKDGSGNLPLPGYMPLFELIARYVSQQLGIDLSVAKAILMIAYAVNPEAFNQLANALEKIHQQLVNEDIAKGINEINKILNLLDTAQGLYDQIEGQMASLVNKGIEPALKELAKRGAESLSKKAITELAKKLNVDEKVVRALMQVPANFNADGMKTVVRDFAQEQVKTELAKRGIDPAFADAFVKGETPRMRSIAERLVDDAAKRALKKQGLGEGAWDMIKSGSYEQAATRMKSDAQSAALAWARNQGFTPAEAASLMNGDVNAASALLEQRGRQQLDAQMARAQKMPEQMQRELAQRGAKAMAELHRRAKEDLAKRGLDAQAADRLVNGDYPGFVSAVRKTGENRIDTWARGNGFTSEEARMLAAGDSKKAASLIAARGKSRLNAQVARANGFAQEVQNAVAGATGPDVVAMERRLSAEAQAALKLTAAEAEALRNANYGALAPTQFKAIVRDVAKHFGWERAAQHFGVNAAELQAFAQSPDAIAEISRVAKLAPAKFVGKYQDELTRQRNLVEFAKQREEKKIEEMLAARGAGQESP